MKKLLTLVSLCLLTVMVYAQEEQFEIDGAIQISDSQDPSPDAGTIRWNTGTNTFEGFDGTSWKSLVMDDDADPTNELQILSVGGDTLYLSDGGFAILSSNLPIKILDSLRTSITLRSIDDENVGLAFQNTFGLYQWNIYKSNGNTDSKLIFAGGNSDPDINDLDEILTMSANGRIGIGTTNPASKFHVIGDTRVNGRFETYDQNAIINQSGEAVDFRVETDTEANMLFVQGSTNRIGIGTNSPTYEFDVHANSAFRGFALFNPTQDTSVFRISTPGKLNAFFVNPVTNRIGIGTNNPQEELHVVGDARFSDGGVVVNAGGGPFGFRVESVSQPAMFVVNGITKKVGIGTADPAVTFDVRGATDINGALTINSANVQPLTIMGNGGSHSVGITQNAVGGAGTMELTTTDNSGDQATRLMLSGNSNSADVRFYRGGQGAEKITLQIEGSNGAVTMSRDSMDNGSDWGLYIENLKATSHLGGMRLNNSGFLELTNIANTTNPARARLDNSGNWSVASDRRLKSDIVEAENLLGKALQLTPVRYHFIADQTKSRSLGFIAQDVQKIFPEMVVEGDILTLNYSGLSVVSIGAIKELYTQHVQLEQRVEELEADLALAIKKLKSLDDIESKLRTELLQEIAKFKN